MSIIYIISAIAILAYAGFNFVFQPKLGSGDFSFLVNKYSAFFISGMILFVIGGFSCGIGISKRTKKSLKSISNNRYSLDQQFFQQENRRIFNE